MHSTLAGKIKETFVGVCILLQIHNGSSPICL